jgi:uncharacterized protein YjiS (DUF1127 family)
MSAPLTREQFVFELPSLTYVDTHLEDPVLPPQSASTRRRGVAAWLVAFRAWRERRAALAELEMMNDRELADIGLTRSDLPRVFNDNLNADLCDRNVA